MPRATKLRLTVSDEWRRVRSASYDCLIRMPKPASRYVLIAILFSGIIINHCMFRILFLTVC